MASSPVPTGEPWDIAVRALLVPDATALARRNANRHQRPQVTRQADELADEDDEAPSGGADGQAAHDEELQAITAVLGPRPWLTLVLDTETRADASQQLRVGYYELRGIGQQRARLRWRDGRLTHTDLDRVCRAGFIASDDPLVPSDTSVIQQYAAMHPLRWGSAPLPVYTLQAFVKEVLYPAIYDQGARLVGHNLFFDLTRFATCWKPGPETSAAVSRSSCAIANTTPAGSIHRCGIRCWAVSSSVSAFSMSPDRPPRASRSRAGATAISSTPPRWGSRWPDDKAPSWSTWRRPSG
jgi:hypothetical protein